MIKTQAAFTCNVRRQIHREPVGIVQSEDGFPGNHTTLHGREIFFQNTHTLLQGLGKAFLFQFQYPFDMRLVLHQLRVGCTHFSDQWCNQFVKKQFVHAQLITMANGATNNTAQHITTSFIGRQHTVHYQEGAGTNMIRNDPQ